MVVLQTMSCQCAVNFNLMMHQGAFFTLSRFLHSSDWGFPQLCYFFLKNPLCNAIYCNQIKNLIYHHHSKLLALFNSAFFFFTLFILPRESFGIFSKLNFNGKQHVSFSPFNFTTFIRRHREVDNYRSKLNSELRPSFYKQQYCGFSMAPFCSINHSVFLNESSVCRQGHLIHLMSVRVCVSLA